MRVDDLLRRLDSRGAAAARPGLLDRCAGHGSRAAHVLTGRGAGLARPRCWRTAVWVAELRPPGDDAVGRGRPGRRSRRRFGGRATGTVARRARRALRGGVRPRRRAVRAGHVLGAYLAPDRLPSGAATARRSPRVFARVPLPGMQTQIAGFPRSGCPRTSSPAWCCSRNARSARRHDYQDAPPGRRHDQASGLRPVYETAAPGGARRGDRIPLPNAPVSTRPSCARRRPRWAAGRAAGRACGRPRARGAAAWTARSSCRRCPSRSA